MFGKKKLPKRAMASGVPRPVGASAPVSRVLKPVEVKIESSRQRPKSKHSQEFDGRPATTSQSALSSYKGLFDDSSDNEAEEFAPRSALPARLSAAQVARVARQEKVKQVMAEVQVALKIVRTQSVGVGVDLSRNVLPVPLLAPQIASTFRTALPRAQSISEDDSDEDEAYVDFTKSGNIYRTF